MNEENEENQLVWTTAVCSGAALEVVCEIVECEWRVDELRKSARFLSVLNEVLMQDPFGDVCVVRARLYACRSFGELASVLQETRKVYGSAPEAFHEICWFEVAMANVMRRYGEPASEVQSV